MSEHIISLYWFTLAKVKVGQAIESNYWESGQVQRILVPYVSFPTTLLHKIGTKLTADSAKEFA